MMLGFIHDLLNPFNWPNKVEEWLVDGATDLLLSPVVAAIDWLLEAIFGALADLGFSILSFFWDAAEPDVSAAWFAGGEGTPYGQMVLLAAPLLLAFLLAGVIGGALRGDAAGMLRMTMVRLPGAVLGMTVVVAIADLLIKSTDEMSAAVLAPFRDDVDQVAPMLGSLAALTGLAPGGKLLLIVFGAVGLLAAVVVVVMLFIRAALIYLVVALSPLIFAATAWESMRGGVRRMAELGFALILAKFAIAAALGLSSSALVAALPDWDPTEIPAPEQADGMSVTQSLGLVVGASVMFLVAAFMPFVVYRLVPLTEAALVEQGIASGPVRAAQTAAAFGGGMLLGRHRSPATASLRGSGGGRGPSGGGDDGGEGAVPATFPLPPGDTGSGGGAARRPPRRRPPDGKGGDQLQGSAEPHGSPDGGTGESDSGGVESAPARPSGASPEARSRGNPRPERRARPASQPIGRGGSTAGGPAGRDTSAQSPTVAGGAEVTDRGRHVEDVAERSGNTLRGAQSAARARPMVRRPASKTPRRPSGGQR